MSHTRLFLTTGVLLLLAASNYGLDAAKPAADVPLTMTLGDALSDGLRSDNRGFYISGADNVKAVLLSNSNGNFIFDTNDAAALDGSRRLIIDFKGQVGPFASRPAFPADVFLGTLATNSDPTNNLRTMKVDDLLVRRTRVSWVEGRTQYILAWDGLVGHGYVNFYCSSGTPCIEWKVTPGGTAGLFSVPTKGSTTETPLGTYTMPFSMTLVKQ